MEDLDNDETWDRGGFSMYDQVKVDGDGRIWRIVEIDPAPDTKWPFRVATGSTDLSGAGKSESRWVRADQIEHYES